MSRFSIQDLHGEHAELMPKREALGLINITNITAVNVSLAINAATVGSSAAAGVTQGIGVFQS
jgi:hypothetical protein